MISTQTPIEVATAYARRGWRVLPVPHREKNPGGNGWQQTDIAETDLPRHFNGRPQNVGVILGIASGGLVDLDLDAPEAAAVADALAPPTPAVFGRDGKPKSHRLYVVPGGLRTRQYRDPADRAMLVELRGDGSKGPGCQTVMPGSTHPSGERVRWDAEGDPAEVRRALSVPDVNRRRFLVRAAASAALAPLASRAASNGVPDAAPDAVAEPDLDALADAARRTERLHALVVVRGGETVLAEAFRGPPVDAAVNVKSVSKSLVAALVGCALERGALDGVDATLGGLAPELVPDGADPRVAALTLEDLLTMRAGLQRMSGPNYGRWASSDDWVRYALTRRFVAEPGGRMLYSTADWHVLGAVLSSVTGDSLLSLARTWLGAPLGIGFAPWTRDPQGRYLGGNEMSMSPLEMVRFGELYRRGGAWDGAAVLADGWAADSFVPRTVSPWSNDGYGYGWFLRRMGGTVAAYARGYGGQLVRVVPEAGLTVAITSDTSRAARGDGYVDALHRLVGRHLLAPGR